ncbi:glycosyltransferase WbuB [Dyadobacter beijingensis]|uniref:Glycosyltransferase WbuB n=1 Tax=Dyadobacter beijingensis TaxID=365489 RepID=A0ABQ2HBZ7_9BACT|nr:glycosyltransferase family 4 protein [Dyadobacter beijingensis]GGM73100.1 glycosyltransferase WbuB [Dyadobacter beijingensis]
MHILLIHQYFLEDHAGGGSRWNEIARIWVSLGHSVTVIAGDAHYMKGKLNEKSRGRFVCGENLDGVRVIRCRVSGNGQRSFVSRFWEYTSFAFAAVYAGFRFANGAYDFVTVTSPPLLVGIPGVILSKCKRIPLVLEIRDLWPESAIETDVLQNKWLIWLSYRLEKLLYRHAGLINVLTPAFQEKLIAVKQVDARKICMIPNAADFRWSEEALRHAPACALRAELGLEGKFVVIYVGAHGLANDLMQLIETATLLAHTRVHFLLMGDGMQKQMLVEEVMARALPNVSFLAPVSKERVFNYIVMADAGVAVLKNAAIFKTVYSNKTFDYFSCKKPVLVAIDGISRELIEEANAGMFAEPGNAADLAGKIALYMQNPRLAQAHGENGYRFARRHFDRTILARNLLDILENYPEKKDRTCLCKEDKK